MSTPVDEHTDELTRCASDLCYWIDNYCYTYDPRPEAAPHHLPFKLYEFQSEYLNYIDRQADDGHDTFTEKSRDMGVSWMHLARMLHKWRFAPSYQGLIGSRKEDLVDNWQLDSLFGKLAYMIGRLPAWMLPKGFDSKRHRQYMKLVNPESGNAIIGESANEQFSRQGRYSEILLDEFGFWPWARSVWTASADAAPVRHVVTTANPGSFAKELRGSGKIQVYSLHWRKHPLKTLEWYNEERKRRTDEDVAQELDINWQGAARGLVYPQWLSVRKGDYPYVPGWPLYVSWDFGIADETALVWWQQNPVNRLWRIVDAYTSSGRVIDWYVPLVTGQVISGVDYTDRELLVAELHRGWPGAIHFGDPAGSQRNQVTGTSVLDKLREFGIYVQTKPEVNTFEARYTTTQLFLRRIEGVNLPACAALDDSMSQARFPERRENSQTTSAISKPIHDFTSHFRTAVEYMAVNEPQHIDRTAKPQRQRSSWEPRR